MLRLSVRLRLNSACCIFGSCQKLCGFGGETGCRCGGRTDLNDGCGKVLIGYEGLTFEVNINRLKLKRSRKVETPVVNFSLNHVLARSGIIDF